MRSTRQERGECWLNASSFIAFQHPLQHPLEACAQSYIPVLVACWKCDRVSLPGWLLEVLVPPAGVQKINVCFTCCSLCSHELDTILSNTVPLVWAESLWIAGKCWPKVAGFFANQASTTFRKALAYISSPNQPARATSVIRTGQPGPGHLTLASTFTTKPKLRAKRCR